MNKTCKEICQIKLNMAKKDKSKHEKQNTNQLI